MAIEMIAVVFPVQTIAGEQIHRAELWSVRGERLMAETWVRPGKVGHDLGLAAGVYGNGSWSIVETQDSRGCGEPFVDSAEVA